MTNPTYFQFTPTALATKPYECNNSHDVVLEYKGQDFPVHRSVVSTFSKFFERMFTYGFPEQDMVHIELRALPISVHLFRQFLNSLYCQALAVTEQNVFDLYYLGEYFMVSEIVSYTFDFIKQLSAPALLQIVQRADEVDHFTFLQKISYLIDSVSFDNVVTLKQEALEVLSKQLKTVGAAKWLLKCLGESFNDGKISSDQIDEVIQNMVYLIRKMDSTFVRNELIEKLGERFDYGQ
ncbi:hypothetical protein P9112_014271 [Eukaryota sp. TZLM1-RC]